MRQQKAQIQAAQRTHLQLFTVPKSIQAMPMITKLGKMTGFLPKIKRHDDANTELLWGLLHVKIINCRGLRNYDRLGLRNIVKRSSDKSDPYVQAFLEDYRLLCVDHMLPIDLSFMPHSSNRWFTSVSFSQENTPH